MKKNLIDSPLPSSINQYDDDDIIILKQDSDIRNIDHKKDLPNNNLNKYKSVPEFNASQRDQVEKSLSHQIKRKITEEDNNYNRIKGNKKLKILVVDDHVMVRDSIKKLVEKCLKILNLIDKYEVLEGIDGVDILYHIIYDQNNGNLIKCVITDENMEYINGSESIMILRNLERLKKIKSVKVASITAFDDEMTKKKIKDSGPDFIFSKPCKLDILQTFLRDTLLN
jgi:CheY-like chemotaxis protein